MIKLSKAFPEDFLKVLPLLFREFFIYKFSEKKQQIKQNSYSRLFEKKWNSSEDHIGYLLKNENEEISGFLGYIFSERRINNENRKFCNLSTWAVKKEYRNQSIILASPVPGLKKNYVIIIHTPSYATSEVFTRLYKFRPLETHRLIIPFLFTMPGSKNLNYHFDNIPAKENISEELKEIYFQHKNMNAHFLLIKNSSQTCLIVFNRLIKKKFIPFCHILYISNIDLFRQELSFIRYILNYKLRTIALMIDLRMAGNDKLFFSFKSKIPYPKLFFSDSLNAEQIDNLYSEYLF
jgi:hypothetical protein